MNQVVPFARSLTDARKHGVAGVLLRNVADQLLDHHRLTDASAAEDTDLSTLLEWADKVDHLDASLEELRLSGEIIKRWCRAVDWESRI